MTQEEIERIKYLYLETPATEQEIIDEINQFRPIPVTREEIEDIIDEIIYG